MTGSMTGSMTRADGWTLGRVYAFFAGGLAACLGLFALLDRIGLPPGLLVFAFLVLTLAAYCLIGWACRTMRLSEFFLVGRRLEGVPNGLAMAVSIAPVGLLGLIPDAGPGGGGSLPVLAGIAGGFLLMLGLVGPFLRAFGAVTVPDALALRYGGRLPRLCGVLVVLACAAPLLAAQLHLLGQSLAGAFDLDGRPAVVAAAALLMVCALMGGLRALTWTQVAQAIVVGGAVLVPLALLWLRARGLAGEGAAAGPQPAASGAGPASPWMLAAGIALGVAAMPQLILRTLATPSPAAARRSLGWAVAFTLLLAAASLAWHDHGRWDDAAFAVPPALAARLPAVAEALVLAGALAASLATAGAVAFAMAGVLGHDLHHRLLDPRASTARRLIVARLALVAVVAGAALAALERPQDCLALAPAIVPLAAAGLLPALVLGVWWRRATALGAVAGMVTGCGLALSYVLTTHFGDGLVPEAWAFGAVARDFAAASGLPPLLGALAAVPVGFAVIGAVSLVTRAAPAAGVLADRAA